MTIKKGDTVEILPAYRDEGDSNYTWIAVDDEEKGRVSISPVDIPLGMPPVYVVPVSQLRRIRTA